MRNNYLYSCLLVLFGISGSVQSQEIKIFTTKDFDLIDSVKTNVVVTKYGKETYHFNPDGRLAKSTTKFNDADYSITYYKYNGAYLIEKRFENYRENTFDKSTSIANFYTIDSLDNLKITEKIIDYNKQLVEQYQYVYKDKNVLDNIIHTNSEGIDNTTIKYETYKGEHTKTYSVNGELVKSIRTSKGKGKNKSTTTVVLTKTYLRGEPVSAIEEIRNERGKKINLNSFVYSLSSKQFEIQEMKKYFYNDENILTKTETTIGEETIEKAYIYQFDNGERGNWIKEIITPDNTYTTRKISYY